MNASKTEDELPREPAVESETANEELTPEQQLTAAVAECKDNHEKWLRAQAELENFRKRVQKDSEQSRLYQSLPLLRDLLPALDNLQRAISAAENSTNVDELRQGVEMVAQQIEEILARQNVSPIESMGKPFDPNLHEAIQQVPTTQQPPMTVLEEVEKGYLLHERVIRPSKVIVSTSPPEENNQEEEVGE